MAATISVDKGLINLRVVYDFIHVNYPLTLSFYIYIYGNNIARGSMFLRTSIMSFWSILEVTDFHNFLKEYVPGPREVLKSFRVWPISPSEILHRHLMQMSV